MKYEQGLDRFSDDSAAVTQSSQFPVVRDANVIGITSSVHGEGVSTIARRMALAMEESGEPVGLLDATGSGQSSPGISPYWPGALSCYREIYRYIIVEMAPLEEGHRSLRVARDMDSVLLVVRANHTRAPVIDKACLSMLRNGVNLSGALLNRYDPVIPQWLYRLL